MRQFVSIAAAATSLLIGQVASATAFTSISPSGVDVTTVGATAVGGIVVQMTGTNGAQVVSEVAANTLYIGYASTNPFTIGTQSGFDAGVLSALGGGFSRASFRFSLFDGDSAAGDFDHNDNTLLVNGITVGNWSGVATQNTDGLGNAAAGGTSSGFRNDTLDTGWFDVMDATALAALYASVVGTHSLVFGLYDVDPGDNYFDFTQGLSASVISVGSGPVVTPPTGGAVPEPDALALAALGLGGLVLSRRRRA